MRNPAELSVALMFVGAAGLIYAMYARVMMLQNRNSGAGMFAEYTGDLTERGKLYQRRCYISAGIAALAFMAGVAIER
jgi:hypothetical protein